MRRKQSTNRVVFGDKGSAPRHPHETKSIPLINVEDKALMKIPKSRAAASALRPTGLLVFTLEHAVGGDNIDYRLELHGRYSHSLAYVNRVLTQSGLTADANSAELRNEAGAPVEGSVVRAAKPA